MAQFDGGASLQKISAELAAAGNVNERGRPSNPKVRGLDAGEIR